MNEERKKIHSWSMPEEDQILFKEYLSSQGGKRITSLPADLQDKYMVTTEKSGNILIGPKSDSNVKSLRSAAAIVRPAGTVYSAYPEYMQNEVASKSQYSSYCGRYLDMSIKDSMYNYVYIEEVSQTFEAMTTVCYIADFFNIAYDIAAGALGGYASLVGSVLTLDTRVKYYFKEAYMFSALRQANIYDYTNYYRDVSVLTEHGTGELCVNWDWDSNEGCYYNPRYAISGIAYPFTIAFATMYDNAQDIWEYNMYEYGYWQWGDV